MRLGQTEKFPVGHESVIESSHHLTVDETAELEHLREAAPAWVAAHEEQQPTFRERVADMLAAQVGSWRFLIIQTMILVGWISANVVGWIAEWDPYPFILLNLLLSFQAAHIAPIIIMSQNRQSSIDRRRAMSDSEINLQAALEIKSLHDKMDALTAAIEELRQRLGSSAACREGTGNVRSMPHPAQQALKPRGGR